MDRCELPGQLRNLPLIFEYERYEGMPVLRLICRQLAQLINHVSYFGHQDFHQGANGLPVRLRLIGLSGNKIAVIGKLLAQSLQLELPLAKLVFEFRSQPPRLFAGGGVTEEPFDNRPDDDERLNRHLPVR